MSQPPPGSAPRYPVPPYPPVGGPLPPRHREQQQSPVMAPVLALLGLLLIAAVSVGGFAFLGFGLGGEDGDAGSGAVPAATPFEPDVVTASTRPDASPTPEPSEALPTDAPRTAAPVVVQAPQGSRADIKGTILFSRGGDIWSASGQQLEKIADGGRDTAPTWSHDGKHVYFMRENKRSTKNGRPGGPYTLYVPDIWRMDADGSNKKRIYSSLLRGGAGLWFSHVLEPDISPDGKTLAVVSDGPNGDGEAVVMHMLPSRGGRLNKVQASSLGSLGHNDPEWSPDGRKVAYTRNKNQGTKGVPVIAIHSCRSRKNCTGGSTKLLRPGYANPSWAPDGTWLAVEATRGQGRDIAIVNSKKGDPRIVLTDDGNSFAPVVSPNGDQIAYLHRDGSTFDLRVMTLAIDESGAISLVDDRAVTSDGALDAESTPAWFIPEAQLTTRPEPAASPSATPQAAE